MTSTLFRVGLCALVLIGSQAVFADQKIKTKSNIKNDRTAQSSSASSCAADATDCNAVAEEPAPPKDEPKAETGDADKPKVP